MTLLEDAVKWRVALLRAEWAEWRARRPVKDRIMAALARATEPLESRVIAERAKVFPALLCPFVLHDLALDGYVTFDVERVTGKAVYHYSITRAGRERLLRVEPVAARGIESSERERGEKEQEDFEAGVLAGRGDR